MRKHQGTKSQIISGMIADKVYEGIEASIPKVAKDPEYISLRNASIKSYNEFKQFLKKRGLRWDIYDKAPRVRGRNEDLVPARVLNQLQKAQSLHALGYRKEASKIWDKLIKQYNLLL